MKIVVLDGYTENPGDLSWDQLSSMGELTVYDRTSYVEDPIIAERIGDAEVVVTNKTPISRRVMDACPSMRFIAMLATGYNVVDIACAKEKGIPVSNVPVYGTHSVSQFAIALLLEICHHIGYHNDTVKSGKWEQCPDWCYWDYPLIELAGKTYGLLGCGNIGIHTAAIASALGMHVIAYDMRQRDEALQLGVEYVSLDELFARSDVLGLQMPLFPFNTGIINRENIDWLVNNTKFDYDMVVIDELSSFKNHQSKRFKALMKVRPKVKRIVGLTGTPASNGLMDLFAEFRLLDMGQRLGRFIGQYRNEYFKPDKQNGYIVYSYKPLPDAEERIYEKISDITVSMKAIDHLKMPELISNEYIVKMSDAEKEKYKELKDELILEVQDTEITAANAAALSNKLCQMSNGAIYDDSGEIIPIHSRKLDALEDIIESANGKPVLVAYWFKHDRTRIAERLGKLGIVYQEIKSAQSIKNWNSGKLQVALIHPASAGHGLNLQAGGNFLVWFGLTWSLELYQQTNARLWRQGQQSETVIIQHIITRGTVDEKILKALTEKDKTQTALMSAVKAELEAI